MLVKLLCFFSGVAITAIAMNPQMVEKFIIDVENVVYPLIECPSQSLANME